MALGRNDNCRCGGPRKYKHCHYEIDRAPDNQKYFAAQTVYSRNWNTTSQYHYERGVYHWLAEQLAGHNPKRVLDIGCGSGHGLVALREVLGADLEIVAIDENRACLQVARSTLRQMHGVDAEVVTRMSVLRRGGSYEHVADPLTVEPGGACVLIESDVCNDPYLATALQSSGEFDAVAIWFTGVHMLRPKNVSVQTRGITTDAAHRIYVQNATYELADAVLQSGGALQVSDRAQSPNSELLRADLLRAHREQASVTSLEVTSLTYRPYEEPKSKRTPMTFSPGTLGIVPKILTLAVLSIISKKP